MFTAHLKQFVNLLKPQFPLMFTNMENTVGKHSSGYKKVSSELKVFRKVVKYEDLVDEPRVYKIFTYDKKKRLYDVIQRQVCKDLTENFGYDYINDEIDSLKEGDTIPAGDVLYRSTSYDEDMNYGYGRNVTVAYTLNPYTSEDAAIASKRICKEFTSIETETIKIGLNGNDYLVDLYGKKGEYKPLPDIGEKTNHILALVRRQFNNQLLFDFEDKSLRRILDSDIPYYIDENVEVIDYTIYDNRDEIKDTPFYTQINKYVDAQDKYYRELLNVCEIIMGSGDEYTREVEYTYKRAKYMVEREKKWKEANDSVFSNMEIEVTIRREVPLAKGCKITG